LFQSRSVKDIIHANHHIVHRTFIAHIADVKLDFRILEPMPHIVLFFLVATEDAYLLDVCIEKTPQHGITERPRATGN